MRQLILIATAATVVAACMTQDDESTETTSEELGSTLTTQGCNAAQTDLLRYAQKTGRWIIDTPEFNQCMSQGAPVMTPTLHAFYCPTDVNAATADAVYHAIHSSNAVNVSCSTLAPDVAMMDPFVGPANYAGPENIAVNKTFLDGDLGGIAVLADVAGGLWHEKMHYHGYTHDNAPWSYCSYSDSQLPIPIFVGDCMNNTLMSIASMRIRDYGFTVKLNIRVPIVNAAIADGGIAASATLDSAMEDLLNPNKLVVGSSNKCVQLQSNNNVNGLPITQSSCVTGTPGEKQRWLAMQLRDLPRLNGLPQYLLSNWQNGRCIDRPNGDVTNTTPIQQWTCHGGPSQRFIRRANSQWEAVGKNGLASGQCLDIPGFSSNDVPLQMSTCKPSNFSNQVFMLRP